MKKQYIKPVLQFVRIKKLNLLAGSFKVVGEELQGTYDENDEGLTEEYGWAD